MSHRYDELLEWFREQGFDEYGAVMPQEDLMRFLRIEVPELGTWYEFQKVQIEMLEPVSYLRHTLLGEGKYLKQDKSVFRVLLPSENASQIRAYEQSASRKLQRAHTLSKNTPTQHKTTHDNSEIRLLMKLNSIRKSKLYGQPIAPVI